MSQFVSLRILASLLHVTPPSVTEATTSGAEPPEAFGTDGEHQLGGGIPTPPPMPAGRPVAPVGRA